MAKSIDLGGEALQRIARVWQVEDDRTIWGEHGFDWWPGSFKSSVSAQAVTGGQPDEPDAAWRLLVRTSFLKEVPINDAKVRSLIAHLSGFAATYSMVFVPPEMSDKSHAGADGTLWLQSSVYLREDTVGWLPEFFARMAILQPIEAERQAADVARMLGAKPDATGPRSSAPTDHRDDMLNVADAFYIPMGQRPNRWVGSSEFAECAEQFGRCDVCFGTGDPTGLTLETPFGDTSALIRSLTDQRHPRLGAGLLVALQLPFGRSEQDAERECSALNLCESISWTGVPQLGSWTPKKVSAAKWSPALAAFVPNALYLGKIATNMALWQLGRARWIRGTFYSDLEDCSMLEIMQRRLAIMEKVTAIRETN